MAEAPFLGKAGKAKLDAAVFEAPFRGALVHECVRAELNARRRGTAFTRTRGEARGGGAKPWRQKGTGRARAGSVRSPLWAGGGVTFGPRPRRYTIKVNRKARRAALRSVLALHAGRGTLAVLPAGAFEHPATREAAQRLDGWGGPRPTLVVVGGDEQAAAKSFRNIDRVRVLSPQDTGIADIVSAHGLVLSEQALEALADRARRPVSRAPAAAAQEVAA